MSKCVLYDRECIDCGECDMCELERGKRCDNCMKCIKGNAEYRAVLIDEIIHPDQPEKTKLRTNV